MALPFLVAWTGTAEKDVLLLGSEVRQQAIKVRVGYLIFFSLKGADTMFSHRHINDLT